MTESTFVLIECTDEIGGFYWLNLSNRDVSKLYETLDDALDAWDRGGISFEKFVKH